MRRVRAVNKTKTKTKNERQKHMKYLKTKDGSIIETDSTEYWTECEKLTQKEGKQLYREQRAEQLRKWIKPGDTVSCILRHVSSSGMSRRISLVITNKETGEIQDISGYVATVLDYRRNDGSLVVGGCGMDMGFACVYNLGRRLFPDGFGEIGSNGIIKDLRPATKEKAAEAVAAGYTFRGRNGDSSGWDNDGGYALNYRWL